MSQTIARLTAPADGRPRIEFDDETARAVPPAGWALYHLGSRQSMGRWEDAHVLYRPAVHEVDVCEGHHDCLCVGVDRWQEVPASGAPEWGVAIWRRR